MADSGSDEKKNLNITSSKPEEKNLLDNVSLMTTLSPMPSNDTSLQPYGTSTRELLDGVFGNVQETFLPESMGDNPVSTFAEMQAKMRAHLDRDSTGGSTAGVDTGNENIMYGFDLSPIHSVDKASAYTTTQEEPPTTEKLNKRGGLDENPNFMEAKGISSQPKSEKSLANNDTETMMSQIFSSQDVISSANDFDQSRSKYERNARTTKSDRNILGNLTSTSKKKSKNDSKTRRPPSSSFITKQKQLQDTSNKTINSNMVSPKSTTKKVKRAPDVVLPRSPPSRQAAVKVTPRIKTKSPKKTPSVKSKRDTHELSVSGTNISKSMLCDQSLESRRPNVPNISGGKQNHDETMSLIHILEDLNIMRSQVADSQEKLIAISKEKEHLIRDKENLEIEMTEIKKENFVLKSRLEKFTATRGHASTTGLTVENAGNSENMKHDQEEVERLLVGYQKENERIYGDLKRLKQSNKDAEQAMYEENLKLKSDIAQLKEELDLQIAMNKAHSGNPIKSAPQNEDLEVANDDIVVLRKTIESLRHQLKAEEGLKIKSDMLVRKLTEERDSAEKKLVDNNCRYEESHDKLVTKHKADMAKLESELEKLRQSLNGKNDAAITIRDIMSTPPSKSMLSHFQKRVKKLQEELESRDTQANHAIASVQKQYSDIKIKYQERIDDLENQIQLFRRNAESQVDSTNVEVLKQQLSEALLKLKKETEQRKMERDTLFEQINALRQQQSTNADANSKNAADLIKECQLKDQEIATLNGMLEKLKNGTSRNAPPVRIQNEKKRKQVYNPGSFEGEGYASLVDLNAQLKKQLEEKELELKHVAITKDATIVKLEQDLKAQKLDFEKEAHKQKIEVESQVVIGNNIKFKIAQLESDLQNRCSEITNLRSELNEMSVFKIREQALQSQVQQLLMQVHQARTTSPSSAARRIAALEDKLRVLEEKLKIREVELKRLQFGDASCDLLSQLRSTQMELERKNMELTKFRLELDSILLVLKELHSQGVKIPLPKYLHSIF